MRIRLGPADPVRGTIPVTGRIAGGRIALAFDLGAGQSFGGVGPFVAEEFGKGRARITSFGSLQTENPADSGDSLTSPPGTVDVLFFVSGETINAANGTFRIDVSAIVSSSGHFQGEVPFTLGGTAQAGVDFANIKGGLLGNDDNNVLFSGDADVSQFTGTLIHHPEDLPGH